METLKPGAKLSTPEPVVAVDPTLKPGTYQVQLVVQGSSGQSAVASLLIKVVKE
jgi:hypothetical protein